MKTAGGDQDYEFIYVDGMADVAMRKKLIKQLERAGMGDEDFFNPHSSSEWRAKPGVDPDTGETRLRLDRVRRP